MTTRDFFDSRFFFDLTSMIQLINKESHLNSEIKHGQT
jgi:hypothetical protein